MQNKFKLVLLLVCGTLVSIASNAAESSPVVVKPVPTSTNTNVVSSPILQRADNDFNQLNELKRQAAIKEQQAKLAPPGVVSSGNSYFSNAPRIADVTVSNVVVNQENSFANLKFPNGETLLVYPGDNVDGYTVRSISMSGVSVAKCRKKCGKSILLKRTYNSSLNMPSVQNSSSSITSSSSGSGDQFSQVPPIIKTP